VNRFLPVLLLFLVSFGLSAQEIRFSQEAYDERRQSFIDSSLKNITVPSSIPQALNGIPIPQASINFYLNRMANSGEFDFDLIQLVRIFYFTNGEYEPVFLPGIISSPLWLTPNERLRVYWSENHTIMWSSSAYLLEQKYGVNLLPDAEKIVEHWLDLKINYGFYEFFSTVYFPFTISAVLNLVDFAENPVIQQKAVLVAKRLLKEILMKTNDIGVYYAAGGRSSYAAGGGNEFESPYGSGMHDLIYLLTGLGNTPTRANRAGAFLATTSLDVKEIVESWKSKEDFIYSFGHSLTDGFAINSVLSPINKTIFQWSSGAYFHPAVATQTFSLLRDYNLWDHKEFKDFAVFRSVPIQLIETAATVAGSISRSSLICQANVAIYKNKSVMLHSIQDYFKGRAGYQQCPWQATAGILPVYTKSGGPTDFIGGQKLTNNSTLPYIEQKSNVALIMYRPNKDLALFGFPVHDVSLKFLEDMYDEVDVFGQWIVGREGDGYIAVARHCWDRKENGVYSCDDQDGQVWAVVVGNADMYGSYERFKALVENAAIKEEWIFRLNTLEWDYYGMVEFDGKKIEHYWTGNLLSFPQNPATSVENLTAGESGFSIYPNPARTQFNLAFTKALSGPCVVRIHDVSGREVYMKRLDAFNAPNLVVNTSDWASGMYTVLVETPEGAMSRKLVVAN
jgi:hypothetical protein